MHLQSIYVPIQVKPVKVCQAIETNRSTNLRNIIAEVLKECMPILPAEMHS